MRHMRRGNAGTDRRIQCAREADQGSTQRVVLRRRDEDERAQARVQGLHQSQKDQKGRAARARLFGRVGGGGLQRGADRIGPLRHSASGIGIGDVRRHRHSCANSWGDVQPQNDVAHERSGDGRWHYDGQRAQRGLVVSQHDVTGCVRTLCAGRADQYSTEQHHCARRDLQQLPPPQSAGVL